MPNFTESGHAKNTANFQHLISIVKTYGANYNPPTNDLAITNLDATHAQATAALSLVKETHTAWKNATNNREIAFEPLKSLSTRLLSMLISCKVAQQTINDYKTINRKIQGTHAKLTKADSGKTNPNPTTTPENIDPNSDTTATPKKVSTSQRSFDNQIDHFDKIIKLLDAEPLYNTNENDLHVTTLKTQLTDLNNLNSLAITSFDVLTNARIARNKTLYNETNGLVIIAKSVKAYIKGKYGADSSEYAQINSIKITKVAPGK